MSAPAPVTERAVGDRPSVDPAARPDRQVRRWHLAVGALLLTAAALGSLFVGVTDIRPADLLQADEMQVRVFLASRVPRLVAVLLAGMAMSVAGLVMQHLARNRFVAPSTAGTVESAGLGILVATVFFGSASVGMKMAIAVLFALLGTAAFLALLQRVTFRDVLIVPLIGLMFGGVIRSITNFFAYRYDLLQTLDAWTNGDFSSVLRGRYELLYLAAVVTLLAYLYADRFTLAGMGKDFAANVGLRYERVVSAGLAVVAVVTGVVVATVGAIPFVGLIVPNLVTMAMGDNLRRVLPVTALAGAAFVLACDILGRTIRYPYEIPVGTVVGVVGSVVFLVLLLRSRHRGG